MSTITVVINPETENNLFFLRQTSEAHSDFVGYDDAGNELHEIEVQNEKLVGWIESQLDQSNGVVSYSVSQIEADEDTEHPDTQYSDYNQVD